MKVDLFIGLDFYVYILNCATVPLEVLFMSCKNLWFNLAFI